MSKLTMLSRCEISRLAIVLMLVLCVICSLTPFVCAHKPGAEFTYLSMFLERKEDSDGPSLEDLYRTYSVSKFGSKNSHSRRLHQHALLTTDVAIEDDTEPGLPSSETKSNGLEENNNNDPLTVRAVEPIKTPTPLRTQDPAESTTPSPLATPLFSTVHTETPMSTPHPLKMPSPEQKGISKTQTTWESNTMLDLGTRHGENINRLVSMLTKLIKQYHIRTLIDVPCRAHAHWMHLVLAETMESAQSESKLQYVCVDTNHNVLTELRQRLAERGLIHGTHFTVRKFWSEPLPKGDLVFSFAGLDNMEKGHVSAFFHILAHSQGRHKLVALGSHSGELVKSGNAEKIARFTAFGYPINVREPPFNLLRPIRIIKVVSTDGNDKQMYLYFPEKMLSR